MRSFRTFDWLLLLDVVVMLALIGLGMVLYFRPAADGVLAPQWWHWVILAALFFTAIGLGSYRARQRKRVALRRAVEELER